MIWGDSHVAAWYPAFDRLLYEDGIAGYSVSLFGCAPALGIDRLDGTGRCEELNRHVYDFIRENGVEKVVLVGAWRGLLTSKDSSFEGRRSHDPESRNRNVTESLQKTVEALKADGISVAFLEPAPGAEASVPEALARAEMLGNTPELRYSIQDYEDIVAPLRNASADADLVVNVEKMLCSDFCAVQAEGEPLYFDKGHPSQMLNQIIYPELQRQFAAFF